jgi:murein DD-endopeptidase MepM/ murein hydrolase activator NlpD
MAGFSFPLSFVPDYSGGRAYGAKRKTSRGEHKHAGVDLMAPVDTAVYAVAAGEVVYGPFLFASQYTPASYAILAKHGSLTVLYGEIQKEGAATKGTKLSQGDQVGQVAQTGSGSMLHIEIYKGNYKKGSQVDPTPYLNTWRKNLPKGAGK